MPQMRCQRLAACRTETRNTTTVKNTPLSESISGSGSSSSDACEAARSRATTQAENSCRESQGRMGKVRVISETPQNNGLQGRTHPGSVSSALSPEPARRAGNVRGDLGQLRGFHQRRASGGYLPMSHQGSPAKRIFVSYSSPDAAKANLIREALEDHDISCWIAPRDLCAGTQWGAGIVQAIQACEAVVVVFSDAANRSPQVAREMELAVSNRKPLIPIRVADAMPTDDMQYFLGVSHWFNAYAMPIEAYLPDIITAVKNVLSRENSPWASVTRRMPRTRTGQIAWSVAGALLIAVVVGF